MAKGGFDLQHDTSKSAEYGTSSRPGSSTAGNTSQSDRIPDRTRWGHKAEFVLACLSLSVGLGNVWRFPYIAYANGGGAFLLPYLIVLFLCGKPMYFMEVAFGQYHQEGAVNIWKRVSPIGKGIGNAQLVIQLIAAPYYNTKNVEVRAGHKDNVDRVRFRNWNDNFADVVMSWTMYYFWMTLIAACEGNPVPWDGSFCATEWAHNSTCLDLNKTDLTSSETPVVVFDNNREPEFKVYSSAQQYFDRVILMRYDKGQGFKYGLNNGDMGGMNWILTANMAGCWLIVFLSLVKGINSIGKVVYVTSTLPFIVIIILLGIGAAQENAVEGILYFVTPRFSKLLDFSTWRFAAGQMFYSLSVGSGSLVTLGSYNQRNNNCYQDAMIVSIADTLTSIAAGLSLFAILGYLAGKTGAPIESVAVSGPGLAFVTFPEAASLIPVSHLWAILFFIMLLTLGIGSQIGGLQTVLTVLYDWRPSLRTKKPLICGLYCLGCFLLGFPFMLQGGIDLVDIFDAYVGGFSVLFPAFFEIVLIMWVYGLRRFVDDLSEMLGKRGVVGIYWRSTWAFLAPLTLFFILVISFVFYSPLNSGGVLPVYTDYIGWALAMTSIIQIPIFAGIELWQPPGRTFGDKLHECLWPTSLIQQNTGIATPEIPLNDRTSPRHCDNADYQ